MSDVHHGGNDRAHRKTTGGLTVVGIVMALLGVVLAIWGIVVSPGQSAWVLIVFGVVFLAGGIWAAAASHAGKRLGQPGSGIRERNGMMESRI